MLLNPPSAGPFGLKLKAWVHFQSTAVNGAQVIVASGNIASISRTASGFYTVTFSVALSTAKYVVVLRADPGDHSKGSTMNVNVASRLVGSCSVKFEQDALGACHLEFWE